MPHHSGGHTAYNRIFRDVPGHHGPGRHNGAIPDGHTGQNGGIGSNPDIPANMNRFRNHGAAVVGRHGMVQRGQDHIVPDQGAVSDKNSALILKFAAHVDKDMFADVDILPAVGVERRKQGKALIHRLADKLRKQGPQLDRKSVV